ncbi:hypothetical protein E1200_29850 [Actinomadura sp. GC306]|uniref:hypothetical protein n=1 Tax=Actinomadura sp. GC306 TaxID=2530367 RepID=UPI001051C389|nr:hypothetical protein [Actinomadura sp. GC306]TDC60812.1 hypothetical protein E1200_29850 [Actinomadura sp. GC306]
MSSYYQIFLRAPEVGERLLSDIAGAAGVELSSSSTSGGGIDFAGGADTVKVQVELSHEFDDDYGIPFSQYPVVVTVIDLERSAAREEVLARDVFNKLAEAGIYSMLFVHDLSVLIDRADP